VTPSDSELVQQALTGSQAAFHELVNRYATPAVNLATRMVQDRALAEDLAQEAFKRAFERLSTFDQQRRFSSWFFQILHHVRVDHLRHRQPVTISVDALEEFGYTPIANASTVPMPDEQAERAAMSSALDAALARIRPEYREVVILRYREELSIVEIAQTMNVPSGTVKTYLYRARKELAATLAQQGWGVVGSKERD
jgi:RNA polymerase sigma-70 factor (ECF subfamily)